MASETNVEDAHANFEDAISRIPSTTSVQQMQSQEDKYSTMEMGKDMGRLLTVLGDVEQ